MPGRCVPSRGAGLAFGAVRVAAVVGAWAGAAAALFPSGVAAAPFLPAVQIRPHDVTEADLAKIRQVGFGGIRFGLRREIVFPKSGGVNWATYDRVAAWAKRHRLRMIVTLFDGRAVNNTVQSQAAWTKGFTAFAAQAARRYPTGVTWEIWNEPNGPRYWPQWSGAAGYTRLAASVCSAIRKVDRRASITAGALGTGAGATPYGPYIRQLAPLVRSGCISSIGVHPYRQTAPETVATTLADIRKAYPGIRFIITEWGYTTAGKAYSSATAQAWAARILLAGWMAKSDVAVLYEWQDAGNDSGAREHNFGMLRRNGTAKPTLSAVARNLKWLRSDVSTCAGHDPNVFCLTRRNAGTGPSYLIWSDHSPNPPLRAALQAGKRPVGQGACAANDAPQLPTSIPTETCRYPGR